MWRNAIMQNRHTWPFRAWEQNIVHAFVQTSELKLEVHDKVKYFPANLTKV
jgi:hypothetical protein